MSEKWFEKNGPYRLELAQSNEWDIVGPEGSRLPRRFERREAEGVCYWMNEAYSFGARRASPASPAIVEALNHLHQAVCVAESLDWHPQERENVRVALRNIAALRQQDAAGSHCCRATITPAGLCQKCGYSAQPAAKEDHGS